MTDADGFGALADDLAGEAADKGCSWCERASGLVLLTGAVALAYIGLDLVTGGRLSRAFIGGVTRAADALDADLDDAAEATAGEVAGGGAAAGSGSDSA